MLEWSLRQLVIPACKARRSDKQSRSESARERPQLHAPTMHRPDERYTACGHHLPSLLLKLMIYRVANALLKKWIGGMDMSPGISVILIEVDGVVVVSLHLLGQCRNREENNGYGQRDKDSLKDIHGGSPWFGLCRMLSRIGICLLSAEFKLVL